MADKNTSPAMFESLFMAGLRATGFVLGARQLKMYVKSLGEVFINDLPERLGTERSAESDAKANVEAFAKIEEKTDAYEAGHVSIEDADGGFRATFSSCPYAGPCSEILGELIKSGQFTKKNLPCLRADITSALISESTGQKTKYELTQFAPGFKCVGEIELL
ncbi:MAG: hypothetical protein PVH29_03475 [Candidatus Zixiibacteriota bacterium]|jgi:hypothetical protein